MWEENGALLGAFSMLSFGECPSAENASHLSQILEASPHPKYSLSAKACLGIVRRAEHRGKELPPLLKALGNSIALPPWAYVLTRLSLCVGCGHPTMASLFDGIGGFPLIWEWLNGKGSCLWASEIEDFPIAVTKYHFPEEGENNEH